ncbi:hypothetical protein AURDEDRAFT_128431 [Auricularia subglabra TFB-10046 SS5]|nr:hypothetical protein AURDEDRAFT_128431 [Auricularia subglabra TFB-10046 SS5]
MAGRLVLRVMGRKFPLRDKALQSGCKCHGTFLLEHHEPFPPAIPIFCAAKMQPAHIPDTWDKIFAHAQEHGDWHGARFPEHLNALNDAIAATPNRFDFDFQAFLKAGLDTALPALGRPLEKPAGAEDGAQTSATIPTTLLPPSPALPPENLSPQSPSTVSPAPLPLLRPTPASTAATTPALPLPVTEVKADDGTPNASTNLLQEAFVFGKSHSDRLASDRPSLKRRASEETESLHPAKRAAMTVDAVHDVSDVGDSPNQGPKVGQVNPGGPSAAVNVAHGPTNGGPSSFISAPRPAPVAMSVNVPSTHTSAGHAPPSLALLSSPPIPAGTVATSAIAQRLPPNKGPLHLRKDSGKKRIKTANPAPIDKEHYCELCHQAYKSDAVWMTQAGLNAHMRAKHR